MKNELKLDPGVYDDLDHAAYHRLPYISNSYLGRMDRCPASSQIPLEDTPTLLFGRALHVFTLEGSQKFDESFIITEKVDKRTKKGQEIWAEYMQDAHTTGRDLITQDEYDKIVQINAAIISHPFAKELLYKGVSEQTVIWDDPETGLRCKCRPDRIPDSVHGVLIDLKSTRDASEYAFRRSVLSYGYHRQSAFYSDGIHAATGKFIDAFAFIAVETEKPFRVEVYTLSPEFVRYGRIEYRRLLTIETLCRKAGSYPNYQNDGAVELFLPSYLAQEIE